MELLTKQNMAVLEKAKLRLRAIQNPVRQKIMRFILANKNRSAVTPIYKNLGMEQAATSLHLRILRDAKIVVTKRESKHVFYSVDTDAIKKLIADCQQMIS